MCSTQLSVLHGRFCLRGVRAIIQNHFVHHHLFYRRGAVSRRIPLISTSVQVNITNTSSTAQSPIKHSFRFRNRNIMFQFYRCIKSYSAVLLGKYSLYRSQAHLGLKPRLCSNTFNKTQGMSHKCTPASITSQDTFSAQAAK